MEFGPHWAVAFRNTVFKVTYFKEALSIGSKGSSIRALRTKGVC
jgi:hypothetical protein